MRRFIFTAIISIGIAFAAPLQADDNEPKPSEPGAASQSAPRDDTITPHVPEPMSPLLSEVSRTPRALNKQIDDALAELSREPSLDALKTAALQVADVDATQTDRWKRAVRFHAVLPTIKFTADMGLGRDESLDRYQDKPDRWGADTDRGYGFTASAQWKLDELVFNGDELKVYDALADRAIRREGLLNLLVSYFFERRRLQLRYRLAPPADLSEVIEMRMRIGELTAAIDALTGGLLSRKITRDTTPPLNEGSHETN